MPASRKHYSKSTIDFIGRIFSVLDGFRHKGKPYLPYLQTREKNDEFLMRDNIVKPLFLTLGYHPQQDFSPEERIATGRVDTIIRNAQNEPVIVIETHSSLLKGLIEHQRRLIDYAEEIGARFAVLSDGVRLEVWHHPQHWKAKTWTQLIKQLNLQDAYRKFLAKGMDEFTESEVYQLLKLKYLSKEFTFASEENLYQEPELDVSDPGVFSQLLEDLQGAMGLVKEEIEGQFELRQREYRDYQNLLARRKAGETIHPNQLKKFEPSRQAIKAFDDWRSVSQANSKASELFCAETMYVLFNRLLLIRIFEDKRLCSRQISNGGIKKWLDFKGFFEFRGVNWAELLQEAYRTMNQIYPHLFRQDVFDWYMPESETVLRILFVFNRYNFRNVDRDVLGKLYERYLEQEERKRLGQFYTPEEVVDYILKAVGYTADKEIEGKLLLDPACGSGGFLVRAVKILTQRLKAKGFDAETILHQIQSCIYGFDINPFAAHLAEMNLLFQVIDLINEARKVNHSFVMSKFNIYATDSLYLPASQNAKQASFLEDFLSGYAEDAEVVRQIKSREGIFAHGFDFVVGNPPYVRTENISRDYKRRLAQDFSEVYEGRFDLYIFFIGLGLKMLKESGKLGFIVPGKFLVTENGGMLRQYILRNTSIQEIVDISQCHVFKDVGNYPVIVIFQGEPDEETRQSNYVRVGRLLTDSVEGLRGLDHDEEGAYQVYTVRQARFLTNFDCIFDIGRTEEMYYLTQKISAGCVELRQVCETHQGIITGKKEASDTAHRKNIIPGPDISSLAPERAKLCRKVIGGKNLPERYKIDWRGEYLIYAPNELTAPRDMKWFETPKLIIKDIALHLTATYDEENFYCLDTIYVSLLRNTDYNLKYILALLNSHLMDFYYKTAFGLLHIGSDYMRYRTQWLDALPIKPAPRETQEELAALVDEMLAVNREIPRIKALAMDFPKLVSSLELPLISLASSPSVVTVNLPPVLGNPKLSLEKSRVYLARKSFIEMADERHARYLYLYLDGIKNELRGKTPGEILQLALFPASSDEVDKALTRKAELESEVQNLEARRSEIDKEIDRRVYWIYGLTDEEIAMVEGHGKAAGTST